MAVREGLFLYVTLHKISRSQVTNLNKLLNVSYVRGLWIKFNTKTNTCKKKGKTFKLSKEQRSNQGKNNWILNWEIIMDFSNN